MLYFIQPFYGYLDMIAVYVDIAHCDINWAEVGLLCVFKSLASFHTEGGWVVGVLTCC